MNDEGRTTAIGLARYARDYYDAAVAADDAIGNRPGYEISAPPPVMFLVAHSIELILKAYLRNCGFSLDKLRKECGHHLDRCWSLAVENDVEEIVRLNKKDIDVLNIISKLHSSNELRYIKTGSKRVPVFGPLDELARKLLDAICPFVGYKR